VSGSDSEGHISQQLATGVTALIRETTGSIAPDGASSRIRPHFSGQAPGEAQTILRQFKGSISAVDPKAMTLAITLADGDRGFQLFKVTAKTKFSRGGKPATFEDVEVGKPAEIVVNTRSQSDEAVTINIIVE